MHPAILPAAGRAPAMGQLLPACTGMSGYSRRGREASGPPLVISKYSPASARTSSSAPLCPPAPPALGREFRFQKAMMALTPAEIPPISDSMKLNWHSHDYSSVSQSVFPGPNPLVPQKPKKYPVFPEGHRQGRWPAAGPGFPADSACMRMLNRIDRPILLLILGTKRVWRACAAPPIPAAAPIPTRGRSSTCTAVNLLQYTRIEYIERLHERTAQSVLYLPVDLSMRAECMHEK